VAEENVKSAIVIAAAASGAEFWAPPGYSSNWPEVADPAGAGDAAGDDAESSANRRAPAVNRAAPEQTTSEPVMRFMASGTPAGVARFG
jgi:uncharacterized protein (DUF1800 family)